MLKVLLVDDEPILIKGLRCLIPWEDYDYEICGTATSGKKAIELVDSLKPDLIITDMVMPEMSGIELIKKILPEHEHIKVVILSGYGEFEYAKKALEYSVFDYLLKPVTREQLIDCICKVGNMIKEEHRERISFIEMNEKLKKSLPLLKDKFLSDLVNGRVIEEKEIRDKAKFLGMSLDGNGFIVLAMEIEDIDKNTQFVGTNGDYLMQFSVMNIITEIFDPRYCHHTFWDGPLLYSILIIDKEIETDELFETLNSVLEYLRKYLMIGITIGIGKKCFSIDKVYTTSAQAKEALKYKFHMEKDAVISYENGLFFDEKQGGYSREEEDRIIDELKYGSEEIAIELGIKMIDRFAVISSSDITQIYEYCLEFYIQLKRYLNDIENESMSSMGEIIHCKTIGELKIWIRDIIHKAYDYIYNQRLLKEYDVIKQAKEYVQNHYAQEISLKGVANIVFMSPTYFSALFKKKTNENFHDYLTKVRMEEASRLLKENNHKTYEVSDLVGYNNARYFSDVFKKFYGVTPSEFREGKKAQ